MNPPLDTFLFESSVLRVGQFRVEPEDPRFRDSGPIEYFPVVFPTTQVRIRLASTEDFVTDRNQVIVYNKDQRYSREKVDPRGDHCHWFSLRRPQLVECLREAGITSRLEEPYPFTRLSCGSRVFQTQRLLHHHLVRRTEMDALWVEEAYLRLFEQLLDVEDHRKQAQAPPTPRASHRTLAYSALELLDRRFREALSLEEIASQLYCSASHLSRVFQAIIGMSLHAYRNQLRLRASLDELLESDRGLSEIALDLGYSSHSHFTQAFRHCFGQAPRDLRRSSSRRLLTNLLKNQSLS